VLFRGKKVPQDVQNLENDAIKISANKSAWIDVKAFEEWIDKVWAPIVSGLRGPF